MSTPKSSQLLDLILQDRIPDNLDLSQRVMQQASSSRRPSPSPRMRTASVVLALAALFLVSSVAYAVYRLVFDPGLQDVQTAGLISDQGTTALPTLQPTTEPVIPPQAVKVANSQTVEGVTLTLDWVYLDSTSLLAGFSFNNLPSGISPGLPSIAIDGTPLTANQQPVQVMRTTATHAVFLSNQVTYPAIPEQPVTLDVSIPLLRQQKGEDVQAATFLFNVPNVPVYAGQTIGLQQIAAVSVNGKEIRLRSVRMNPSDIEVILCPAPVSSASLVIDQAILSASGSAALTMKGNVPVADAPACRRLTFDPVSLTQIPPLTLTVNQNWQFSIEPPDENLIPGVVTESPNPAAPPLAVEAIDNLSMTLDWVFVDARRIAFGYTISGFSSLPDSFILGGTVRVTDNLGNSFSSMGGQSHLERVTNEAGTLSGTWSTILQKPLDSNTTQLSIDITLDGSHGNDWNYTIAGPVYPANGPTAEMVGAFPAVVPSGQVGTFHFDVNAVVYPETILQPAQVNEANHIQMELVQAELTPSYSSFILCYTKPTGADWMLANATLTSGLEQTQMQSYTLLSDNQFSLKKQVPLPPVSLQGENLRCARVDFLLGHANQKRTITLTVPALERSAPEVFPQAELDAALAKLKQQGIEMTYISMRGTGGGGSTWQYNRLPEGMTEEQAFNLLIDALGYRFPGPWTFSFEYEP